VWSIDSIEPSPSRLSRIKFASRKVAKYAKKAVSHLNSEAREPQKFFMASWFLNQGPCPDPIFRDSIGFSQRDRRIFRDRFLGTGKKEKRETMNGWIIGAMEAN
jgi:hypothetical protein